MGWILRSDADEKFVGVGEGRCSAFHVPPGDCGGCARDVDDAHVISISGGLGLR